MSIILTLCAIFAVACMLSIVVWVVFSMGWLLVDFIASKVYNQESTTAYHPFRELSGITGWLVLIVAILIVGISVLVGSMG